MKISDRKSIGRLGEDLAEHYLIRKGFDIIDRNFQIVGGEIDIVAKDEGSFVFVEVKTRLKADDRFHPEDSVGYKKKERLINTAKIWLSINVEEEVYWQIDVISIIITRHGKIDYLEHFENVVN